MKKGWTKLAGINILAIVVMILVGLVSFRTVAPTGVLIAPVAGIISLAVTVALGTVSGVIVAVVSGILLMFLQNADWLLFLNFVILAVFVGWIIGWRIPLSRRLSHQQLIWLGILGGICELVLTILFTALMGWRTDGNWLAFVRLNLLPTILTALLDAVLIGPVALVFRWLAKQVLPPEDDGENQDPHGPVEINLSEKKKKKKQE